MDTYKEDYTTLKVREPIAFSLSGQALHWGWGGGQHLLWGLLVCMKTKRHALVKFGYGVGAHAISVGKKNYNQTYSNRGRLSL